MLAQLPDRVLERAVLPVLLEGLRAGRMPELRWTFQLFRARFASFGRQLQLDGLVEGDGRALLERAVRVDPGDGPSWRLLLRCHVDVLDFAQHHLDVGDELELDADVCRGSWATVREILGERTDVPPGLRRQAEQLAAMFDDYFEWLDGDRRDDLRDWCRARGRAWWFM